MPDPVTGISAGVGLLTLSSNRSAASAQSDAARQASDAQSASAAAGIAEQRRQFDLTRELLQPYTEAGAPALAQQQAFLGLGGAPAQQQAIQGIEQSPAMQAMMQQGENAMLQNASATGGLRGGNVQGALAQFRPQLLNQLIEQQYSRLGGLTSLGQASAAGQATAGMQTGTNIANLLGQQGQALAGGAMGKGGVVQQTFGNLMQMGKTASGMM